MHNFFRSGYSKVIGIIAVLAIIIGIPLVILNAKSQQNLQQSANFPSITIVPAWLTSQSANAVCTGPDAVIHVTFTNTESGGGATNAMKVTVKDNQTGNTLDLGVIQPGQTKTGDINTGKTSLQNGTVTFNLSWANGRSGTDSRTASYNALTCHVTPTPTPVPSHTPTPTNTPTPTPKPSITPTNTPVPSATNTPTPTICVTPGAVTNVRVSCSTNCNQP